MRQEAANAKPFKIVAQENEVAAGTYVEACKAKAAEDPSGVTVAKNQLEVAKVEVEVVEKPDDLIELLVTDVENASSYAKDMSSVSALHLHQTR